MKWIFNWPTRIRTLKCWSQSPVPYHLAMGHCLATESILSYSILYCKHFLIAGSFLFLYFFYFILYSPWPESSAHFFDVAKIFRRCHRHFLLISKDRLCHAHNPFQGNFFSGKTIISTYNVVILLDLHNPMQHIFSTRSSV